MNSPLRALFVPFDIEGVASAFHQHPAMHQGCARLGAGVTGPKQMWEPACRRCAALAALDFTGAATVMANPWGIENVMASTCKP
ncbi:hypothetical protein, partial [Pseudomonas juntendi]|uniref:hypothetical protein n=1 Tax=Pseudomonas juntendi TaxID=2666183 RepID=UPI001F25E6AF